MGEATRALVVVAAVTLVAGGLRFWGVDEPRRKVFDEVYYGSDGCWYAGEPFKRCGLESDGESSWVHPPLGKWAIAGGIAAAGNDAFGRRLASAVAGTATIALAGALAFLLWGSALWAGIGALLLAVEHLHFVQSRIAMLDVFLVFFVVLGFTLLVWDRRRQEGHRPGGVRPLRLGAGAAFGAAIAVKWSGVLALAGAMVLALAWAASRFRAWRREEDPPDRRTFDRAWLAEGAGIVLALVVVPLVAYLLAWVPWVAGREWSLGELASHHGDMFGYHWNLETVKESGEPIHPYMSEAWTWLLLLRPVAYFWNGGTDCGADVDVAGCAEILGIGNPVLFWTGLLVIPYLALAWWLRRDWRYGSLLVPIAVQYLPWLAVSRPLFLFYMAPITPFLALGATAALRGVAEALLPRRWLAVPAVALLVLAAVGVFAFFWPVLTGQDVTYDAWRQRMWLGGWV